MGVIAAGEPRQRGDRRLLHPRPTGRSPKGVVHNVERGAPSDQVEQQSGDVEEHRCPVHAEHHEHRWCGFEVQDRGYREDVADFQTGYRDQPGIAAGQDHLVNLLGEQEIYEEALHGFQTPNSSHPRFRHVGGEKHRLGLVLVLRGHFLRVLGGSRAKPTRWGSAAGVETAGTHLQRAQGQGGLLLNDPDRIEFPWIASFQKTNASLSPEHNFFVSIFWRSSLKRIEREHVISLHWPTIENLTGKIVKIGTNYRNMNSIDGIQKDE